MPGQDILPPVDAGAADADPVGIELDPISVETASGVGRSARPVLRRTAWMLRPTLLFLAARLATLVAAGVAAEMVPGLGPFGALQKWDGAWFLGVIRHGYPAALPMIDGHVASSTVCFFPVYPLAVRAVHGLGIGVVPAAFVVTTAGGLAATLGLWRLLCALRGPERGDRVVAPV